MKTLVPVYLLIILVMYLYMIATIANEFIKQANKFNRSVIEQIYIGENKW